MATIISNSADPDRVLDTSTPYNPMAYDSLPGLNVAASQFAEFNALTTLLNPIRDLFLKHKVNQNLGIALLHKHFPIKPTERLVDCRKISAAWDMGDDMDAITHKYDSSNLPRSFRLLEGKFVPYEFNFVDENCYTADANHALGDNDFLSELASLLRKHGLDQVLGLRVLDKHDSKFTVEITEGKMNIMIRRGIIPEKELIQALWIFGKDEDEACHCEEYCRVNNKGEHFESNHRCR